MAGTDGNADRRLMFIAALGRTPERFDFYQAMRRIEAGNPALPRLGEARRPSAEPLRLAQEAELAFAVANLTRVDQTRSGLPGRSGQRASAESRAARISEMYVPLSPMRMAWRTPSRSSAALVRPALSATTPPEVRSSAKVARCG